MEKKQPEGLMRETAKKASRFARVAVAGLALGASADISTSQDPEKPYASTNYGENIAKNDIVIREFFDSNPSFLNPVLGGEFSKGERESRTEILPNGEEVFRDIGATFYKTKKRDTIGKIKEKLSAYPEFSYLKDQKRKVLSFNIPDDQLPSNTWIPIPLEAESRHLTVEEFLSYTTKGIKKILEDSEYADEVEDILKKITMPELEATLVAIAKQESGGEPIGSFVYHKWEPRHKTFSYSPFHILNEGPGLKARQSLNLSIGQTYHPQNATEFFLGFISEKAKEMRKRPDRYFPITEHLEEFSVFYNGKFWKETNPDYADNISKYYDEALPIVLEHWVAVE